MTERSDVVILGGGLAGLTLSLQLKRSRPETTVVVAEKRAGPAPEAAFKVGESTVELSANYFANTCGMKDHLEAEQLEKNGLRFFFTAGDNTDITKRVEWGSTKWLDVPSYQLDRGRFENALVERCQAAGVDVQMGAFVEDVELGGGEDGLQAATIVRGGPGGERSRLEGRWLVDASGRAAILKRKLGLAKDVPHKINSSWFRLANGLDIEAWGAGDAAWLARMAEPGLRRFSTNHLMGEGYWVWLIPLSSGSISIGIVADPRFHAFDEFDTLEGALAWFGRHEPQLADALRDRVDDVEDFLKIESFAHGCERVFSPERWALSGESGVFLDPFYSPGSDFIAMANTHVADLIERDLAGEPIAERAEVFNRVFLGMFDAILTSVYNDHYAAFGSAQVMHAKVLWDYFGYWSMNAFRSFHGKLCDLRFTGEITPGIQRALSLSGRMGQLFRDWNAADGREWRGAFIEGRTFPALWDRHLQLVATFEDDEALKNRFLENVRLMEALAVVLFSKAVAATGDELPADRPINPHAIVLDPGRWDEAGLFSADGLTVDDARALLPGVENMLLDELERSAQAELAPA
jgi:flavin-dependent dehydrogenase